MTNKLNTPIEVLEHVYPVRVHRYALRRASGGRGKFRGGDGSSRNRNAFSGVQVAVLSDRRKIPPYGLSEVRRAAGKTETIAGVRVRGLPSNAASTRPQERSSDRNARRRRLGTFRNATAARQKSKKPQSNHALSFSRTNLET